MDDYITTKEAREKFKVSVSSLRRWDAEGVLRTTRTLSNRRRFNQEDLKMLLGCSTTPTQKQSICYARVSSKKQTDDLERQQEYLKSKYPNHRIITDVGSGLNWQRKGLQTLLGLSLQRNLKEVVVAHKDRLCRFAWELLKWIFETNGATVIVCGEEQGESDKQELADDIMSIIHIYSCREMGKRKYKNKKNPPVPDDGTKEISKGMDGNS